MSDEKKCKDCYYVEKNEQNNYECHRYPPKSNEWESDTGNGKQCYGTPRYTNKDCWCGEFKSK